VPHCWYLVVASQLRRIYFSSVRIVGSPLKARARQIIISSHRNGAVDGYAVIHAFPRARFLVSAQLLRNALLRLMFGGIPVVREKDRTRYGMRAADHANPILVACRHVRDGGSLAMFPEGSSEWGPRPLPYETGTARIVRMLLSEGVPVEVVPVGLFYRCPDRFRSALEILVGDPVALPKQGGADRREWERQIHEALTQALDAVSVDCADLASFERAERLAAADAADGGSYAIAFKRHEREDTKIPVEARATVRTPLWGLLCGLPGMVLLAPVLLVGYLAGRKAESRNTVTFFRMAGGFAASLIWLPILLVLLFIFPLPTLLLLALAVLGWPAFRR
jgi:1-acyl-sn-glycerol-3-phosphate acyltransferase